MPPVRRRQPRGRVWATKPRSLGGSQSPALRTAGGGIRAGDHRVMSRICPLRLVRADAAKCPRIQGIRHLRASAVTGRNRPVRPSSFDKCLTDWLWEYDDQVPMRPWVPLDCEWILVVWLKRSIPSGLHNAVTLACEATSLTLPAGVRHPESPVLAVNVRQRDLGIPPENVYVSNVWDWLDAGRCGMC